MLRKLLPLIPVLMCWLVPVPSVAESVIPATGPVTGWPMPRFVSLKAAKANMRTGPSRKHPIHWRYQRKSLPMMVIDEWDHWRKVVDSEGESGWMHKSLLSGKRTAMIIGTEIRILRTAPSMAAPPVVRLSPRVVGTLAHCQEGWCHLTVDKYAGWLPAAHLFGGE